MPDLTDPKIFPAVLAVSGVLFTVLVNTVFTLIHSRINFRNNRFFDAYGRRLAVYEDVIKELILMTGKQDPNTIRLLSGIDMSKIIIENLHTLDTLISRLLLYGSSVSCEPLWLLRKQMFSLQDPALAQALASADMAENSCK